MDDDDAILTFPCEFPIKIVGLTGDTFEIAALSIIRTYFPEIKQDSLKTRTSKEGKYLAITVIVTATSQAQLDAVYQALTDSPDIVMAL